MDPRFKSFTIFGEDLVAVELQQNFFYNRPIIVGFSVLELSKFWLYRFLYESLKHIRDVTDPQSLIFQFISFRS